MSNRVAPEPSSDTAYFGVAKNFRKTHGEAAFMALATAAFTESDADGSGSIDKSELRGTLKKLGIRLPGQTDAILQYYDKDGNGTIEEAEFITLVSDLIDGTFATTLQPKLEAKMKQEQAQHAQQQQQAHLQQQAALQQTVLAQQAQLQQHSQVDQQRLAAENANLKATNNTLKEQAVALKKKVKQLERKTEDMEELNARACRVHAQRIRPWPNHHHVGFDSRRRRQGQEGEGGRRNARRGRGVVGQNERHERRQLGFPEEEGASYREAAVASGLCRADGRADGGGCDGQDGGEEGSGGRRRRCQEEGRDAGRLLLTHAMCWTDGSAWGCMRGECGGVGRRGR
jgi:hypothetical protein